MKKWLERLMKQMKDEKGLTLIELLAVIVILGIIAAIAVPSITGITSNTKKEAHRANATQIVEAAKQYVAINGFKNSADDVAVETTVNRIKDDGASEKEKDLAKGTYMLIELETLQTSGFFPTGIVDPESSDNKKYNKDNTVIIVQESGSPKVQKYWLNLVGDKTYFTNMNYDDILNDKAKPAE